MGAKVNQSLVSIFTHCRDRVVRPSHQRLCKLDNIRPPIKKEQICNALALHLTFQDLPMPKSFTMQPKCQYLGHEAVAPDDSKMLRASQWRRSKRVWLIGQPPQSIYL